MQRRRIIVDLTVTRCLLLLLLLLMMMIIFRMVHCMTRGVQRVQRQRQPCVLLCRHGGGGGDARHFRGRSNARGGLNDQRRFERGEGGA